MRAVTGHTTLLKWTTGQLKREKKYFKKCEIKFRYFKGRNVRVINYFSGSSSSGLILLTLGIPLGSLLLSSVLGMDDVELGLRSLCSS
jgi:hypothetical protein